MIERLANIQQKAYAKRVGVEMPPSSDDSDDDSVRIGDEFREVHNYPPASPAMAQWLLAAALGAAVGIGSIWIATRPAIAPPPPNGTDADTLYRLDGDWEPHANVGR